MSTPSKRITKPACPKCGSDSSEVLLSQLQDSGRRLRFRRCRGCRESFYTRQEAPFPAKRTVAGKTLSGGDFSRRTKAVERAKRQQGIRFRSTVTCPNCGESKRVRTMDTRQMEGVISRTHVCGACSFLLLTLQPNEVVLERWQVKHSRHTLSERLEKPEPKPEAKTKPKRSPHPVPLATSERRKTAVTVVRKFNPSGTRVARNPAPAFWDRDFPIAV